MQEIRMVQSSDQSTTPSCAFTAPVQAHQLLDVLLEGLDPSRFARAALVRRSDPTGYVGILPVWYLIQCPCTLPRIFGLLEQFAAANTAL